MSSESKESGVDRQIDDNLRRVFQELSDEELPDRLKRLMDELKKQGGTDASDKAS